jgi:hypothetical protein
MQRSRSTFVRHVAPFLVAAVLLAACGTQPTAPQAPPAEAGAAAEDALPTEELAPTEDVAAAGPEVAESVAEPTSAPVALSPTETPAPAVAPTQPPTTTADVEAAAFVTPTLIPLPAVKQTAPKATPVALTRLADTDPAPPLTVVVHTIAAQDNGHTRLTGMVRNDAAETYEGVAVLASFVDDQERGQGPVEVYVPCPYLEPGAECPFALEVYGTNMVSYRLHPSGHPVVYGQLATVAVRVSSVSSDGVGNVRITGTATNEFPVPVSSVTVAGTLLDRDGLVVSTGWDLVYGELEPGASAPFDLRIEYRPWATYQVVGQATRR